MNEGTVTISIKEYDRLRELEQKMFKSEDIYTIKMLQYDSRYNYNKNCASMFIYKIPSYSIITTNEIIKDLIIKSERLLDLNVSNYGILQDKIRENEETIKELSKMSIWGFKKWRTIQNS